MKISIVIPARYNSSRLKGKPLADICGKPMIQHVYEKAMNVEGIHSVIIATDDQRIAEAVEKFGGKYLMTSPNHQSGTERLIEIMERVNSELYINLQGDEPLVRSKDIQLLVDKAKNNTKAPVATLYHKIAHSEALNINTVKLILDEESNAVYFSRLPIPYQTRENKTYLKHVGIYSYTRAALKMYSTLAKSRHEEHEKLEQLRLISSGIKIQAFEITPTGPGVDTEESLHLVRKLLSNQSEKSKLSKIKLVVTDVDGVLSDGTIYYDQNGENLKSFHVKDGLGIKLLLENNIMVAILSGRDSHPLRRRIKDLGIKLYELGSKEKEKAVKKIMEQAGVKPEETVMIGDDLIDIPAFKSCGVSFAVADSPHYVKESATLTLETPGGKGAFREVADKILVAQEVDILNFVLKNKKITKKLSQ